MASERFGPYEIEAQLGRGGMGEVHRAVDLRKGRTVALKRLPADLAGDPTLEARFRREAEVAARLTDPHVIPIHDYGVIQGRLFLDMRLVQGIDLGDVIRGGPIDPRRAVAILGQVAGALDAAHRDGLVHRDVKPSNVLLVGDPGDATGEDFVYLIDFGIATGSMIGGARLTTGQGAIGTAAYMAPERFDGGREDDPRVDVYALGCVFYEMLTGQVPFDGTSYATIINAHLNTPPPAPSRLAPLPPGLDAVVARALAKDPAQRFARAGELAEAARRAIQATPAPGPPPAPAPTRRTPPWLRHEKSDAATAAPPAARAERPPVSRVSAAIGDGARAVGNLTALLLNTLWMLVALGALAATGGSGLAIGGAAAVGGGLAASITGLTGHRHRRNRWTVLGWGLLAVSFVLVILAASYDA